ncbi:hypothetical protein [Chryseobacterium sp. AG363]|uniref:hypothetical protein n=1 Tax=Chryseobacterium sp. AG363 TaxID=2183997 RepID=UPI000E720496|nr:hypothetical protein [Chryseobacterium sp. AG363]RKE82339.1 hypothetical protein DEU39_1895 [Chryseobacterium sp. AG363]
MSSNRQVVIDANNTSNCNSLQTNQMFNTSFTETDEPPIDTYFNKTRSLILLINPAVFNELTANLVVLGYISVFESYMREIIRRTILIDDQARKTCEAMPLSYGAAISHTANLLPEAILEDVSFAGKNNVKDSLKNFLGIKGHLPNSLSEALNEFAKVCEIRHCLVHRFGKLGTKNAIKLGLSDHSPCIEKPLRLTYALLQEIQLTCNVVVKEINNYIFNSLLQRLILDDNKKITSTIWHWNYNQDRRIFVPYYKTFVSTLEVPPNHVNVLDAYNIYRNFYRSLT